MANLTVRGLVVLITLSEVIINTCNFIHGNSHAGYIPKSNEVKYLHNGVRISKYEEDVFASSSLLSLTPRVLDFENRPLGVPHQEKVTVFNTDSNTTIHLTSISGTTPHFHCSFFDSKVVPPLGNTTFSVVFLGREEGQTESMLFIHTSEGTIKFQVKGNSVSSPYRLRPLVGLQMPINASFSPLIHMHNPHPNPIQIMEIYSSGGDVNLELPTGELEAVKELWQIQPFETKAVIRAKFRASVQRNHTCYLRIRLNGTADHLVVPFEVEVGSSAGLYPPEPIIDLGTVGSEFSPQRFAISLLNSGKKAAIIENVYTVPATDAVEIKIEGSKVLADSKKATRVATITFYPSIAYKEKHISGTIVVKGKTNIIIPYHVTLVPGGLHLNSSFASFWSNEVVVARNLVVRNTFHHSLVISNVTLAPDAAKYFEIHNFFARTLKRGTDVNLFRLVPKADSPIPKGLRLDSSLDIVTNVSVITVPVLCYDGKILKLIAERDQGEEEEPTLDLGLVATRSERSVDFILHNPNPVPVSVEAISVQPLRGGDLEMSLDMLGTGKTSHKNIMEQWVMAPINLTADTTLQPKEFAVFNFQVRTGFEEGYFSGELMVRTKFDTLLLPFRLKVSKGQLNLDPKTIVFDSAFPGSTSVQPLYLHSEFQQHMKVVSLSVQDRRITFVKIADVGVKPFSSSPIGELQFDPQITCFGVCYLGVDYETQAGASWLEGMTLNPSSWRSDVDLLNSLYLRYNSSSAMTWLNTTLRMDTTEVRGHLVQLATRLIWPTLFPENCCGHLQFPLTQVGNSSSLIVKLYNPSDSPLVVQLVVGQQYASMDELLPLIPEELQPPGASGEDSGEFEVVDDEEEEGSTSSELHDGNYEWDSNLRDVEALLGVKPHPNTISFVLEPKNYYPTVIKFTPKNSHPSSSLLFVKNNLTVLEVFRLSGQGSLAQFKFGNRKSGISPPLQFDMPKRIEKECKKGMWSHNIIPLLSVRRSFTARNTGDLPVYVSNFHINNLACEGYGFKVSQCQPFVLPVNSSKKIELSFTPDFTLARVQRMLKISTSVGGLDGGVMNYTLVATVPADLLTPCSRSLPRPPWEKNIYWFIVVFMLILLALIMAGALVEAERIHKLSMTNVAAALTKNKMMSNRVSLPNAQQSTLSLSPTSSSSSISSSSSSVSSLSPTFQSTKNSMDSAAKAKEPDLQSMLRNQGAKEVTKMSPQASHIKVVRRKVSKKQSSAADNAPDGCPAENPPSPPSSKESRAKGGTAWSGMFGRGSKSKDAEPDTKKALQRAKRTKVSCESTCVSTTSGEGSPTPSMEETYENKERLAMHRKNLNAASHKLDLYEPDTEEDFDDSRSFKVKTKQTKASLEQPLEPLINKKKVPLVAPEQPKRKKEKVHRGGTPMFFQPQPMAKNKKLIPVNYKDILSSESFLYDEVEDSELQEKSRPVTPPPPPRPAPSSPVENPPCPSPLYSTVLSPLADSTLIDLCTKKESPGPIGPKCSPKGQPLNLHWGDASDTGTSRLYNLLDQAQSFQTPENNGTWDPLDTKNSLISLMVDRRRRVEQHLNRSVISDAFPAGASSSSDSSWNNWSFDPPSLNTVVTSSPASSSPPPTAYNAAHAAADNDNKSLWSYSGNNTSAWSNTPAQPTLRPPMEYNPFESAPLWGLPNSQQQQQPQQPPPSSTWFQNNGNQH